MSFRDRIFAATGLDINRLNEQELASSGELVNLPVTVSNWQAHHLLLKREFGSSESITGFDASVAQTSALPSSSMTLLLLEGGDPCTVLVYHDSDPSVLYRVNIEDLDDSVNVSR